MHFKREKPTNKKLTDRWGTPKEYQTAYGKERATAPAKKPSWYCKKLKGKHNFIRTGAEDITSSVFASLPLKLRTKFEYYRCNGCSKQKIKTIQE